MTDLPPVLTELAGRGGIGALRCGAHLAEAAAELGPPVDLGPVRARRRWPHRFGYGDVELAVCRCRLVTSLSLTLRDGVVPKIPRRPVTSAQHPAYPQVVAALDGAGIGWEPVAEQPTGQVALHTAPGGGVEVGLVFTTTADGAPVLAEAGAWITTAHDCPPVPEGTPDDGTGVAR